MKHFSPIINLQLSSEHPMAVSVFFTYNCKIVIKATFTIQGSEASEFTIHHFYIDI
jgi:hypothetical protein